MYMHTYMYVYIHVYHKNISIYIYIYTYIHCDESNHSVTTQEQRQRKFIFWTPKPEDAMSSWEGQLESHLDILQSSNQTGNRFRWSPKPMAPWEDVIFGILKYLLRNFFWWVHHLFCRASQQKGVHVPWEIPYN